MIDIIIPVYNEGQKVIRLLGLFEKNIKNKFNIFFCYDDDNDDIFNYSGGFEKFKFPIKLIKNKSIGPCSAVITGLEKSKSDCKLVYPADDFINTNIIDIMFDKFNEGADIVVASRFIKGGSMKGCPMIKSFLVRTASFTLHAFSSIPVEDASNGFRMFSKKLLNKVKIQSKMGFAYSLELLVKCNRLGYKISEVPAQWEERSEGQSNFKILRWLGEYLRWYIYGLKTFWLKKREPIDI